MSPRSSLGATLTQIYPPRPAFTEANVPAGSQNGSVFIVTGGNSDVGFELCKILYAAGATVYMASRSQATAEVAIKEITAAAESFAQKEEKLDVLWNNAGTGANGVTIGQRTAQGLESMIGMHCVATLLFTQLLPPQLRAATATSGTSGKTRVV
ncbi:hypothetical protein BBP40_002786 [Aspergillus hancockii]|nr:hypothetical protein BBP40_002786 [Aspergillus hancockii]